jgi:4-aminobutyrate aminotransferase-like enzyme
MDIDQISGILRSHFGLSGEWEKQVGFDDYNLKLTTDQGSYIVKISESGPKNQLTEDQCKILSFLAVKYPEHPFPQVIQTKSGQNILLTEIDGKDHLIRVYTWLDGDLFKNSKPSPNLYNSLGLLLGSLNSELLEFKEDISTIVQRVYYWDLQYALLSKSLTKYITDPTIRRIVDYFFHQFEVFVLPKIPILRKGIIHSDANDYNILVNGDQVSGLIDFGDAAYSSIINELAIAIAYAALEKEDPVKWALEVVKGYNSQLEIQDEEIDLLYILVGTRLAVSLSRSGMNRSENPEDEYLVITEKPAMELIQKWIEINPESFKRRVREELGKGVPGKSKVDEALKLRSRHVNPSLSISYGTPLKMVGAAFQYMYADDGNTYLDCVNNICHVGHGHPRVVEAGRTQMAVLNTNTRYLYDNLNEYAEMLTAKFPDPLDTVFLVNSGSEAGDLSQRIARTVTGEKNTIVVNHGYHGNTIAGIEVSPYKHSGMGGSGQAEHIHRLNIPDGYRGEFKYSDPDAGNKYASHVDQVIEEIQSKNEGIAAFYSESIIGCGGQVTLPQGYLKEIYGGIRQAGGLCIVDEVQVGFGRVGEKFWGFELQDVVPDIVVLGKPMGNGHPLAAVVTTRAIADQFNNGMEFFSSFGGNPVSCAIGMEVLNVIEDEHLQEHALATGNYFKEQLQSLASRHALIGDVRGYGLFLGVELVEDPELLTPATDKTKSIVEEMRNLGILLSTDGPYNNVIKIKPPLVFNSKNVDLVIDNLDQVLANIH